MLSFLTAPLACTTTLAPPDPASLREPVTVYLVDQGRTASLVLPDERGGMIRYAYGDWCWYAVGKHGALEALAAMLLPTRGALGRKAIGGPATVENLRAQVKADHVYALTVERAAVRSLRAKLERIVADNRRTLLVNRTVGLEFVHHPRAYCAFYNSNHAVAEWLGEIGVRSRGLRAFSEWEVKGVKRAGTRAQTRGAGAPGPGM